MVRRRRNYPFESPPEGEAQQIKAIDDLTIKILDARYTSAGKRVLRQVHPKSHGCVKATFQVLEGIDESLRVGLFSDPGKQYDTLIRYSNASGIIGPDTDAEGAHVSRGMAMKVLGVKASLLDDEEVRSQDFLMINAPSFAFANVADYLRLSQVLLEDRDKAARFFSPLHPSAPAEIPGVDKKTTLRTFQLVQKIQATPTANPLEVQYFGAAPFRFGPDRVMKFSARPVGELKPQVPPTDGGDDYLRDALMATMQQNNDIVFDFMVQVRGPGDGLGIEDASHIWEEADVPFHKVARVTIPTPQSAKDLAETDALCTKRAFTPWHSLPEHEPIGGINRLRKSVYLASFRHRTASGT